MSSGANFFLKKTLGEDFFEVLAKTEIYKPGSRTTVDVFDIAHGLKLVPRALMALLIKELVPMIVGETKEIIIPSPKNALLKITKHERDSLSGEIIEDNKKIAEFMHRSIPGVGLVLMSALELYNTDKLLEPVKEDGLLSDKIQKLVDERLALHDLIGKVVDKKISERDAIQQLILAKLTENFKAKEQIAEIREIHEKSTPQSDPYFHGMSNGLEVANSIISGQEPNFVESPKKKASPLKDFLAKREGKLKKNEFSVIMAKGEECTCPDCGARVFDGDSITTCVCYGDCGKVFLKKTEDGIKVRFSSNWEIDNIEMLLEVLRKKNG